MSANTALKPQTMTHPATCEKQSVLQTLCPVYKRADGSHGRHSQQAQRRVVGKSTQQAL